jgi:flagellar biosynthesis chaperone FliJ
MKRFRFALESLLRLQRQRQRLAEVEQARAFRQWWEARQQLLALEQHALAISQSAAGRLPQPDPRQPHPAPADLSPPGPTTAAYWFLLGQHIPVLHLVEKLAQANEMQQRQVWEQRQQQRLAITRQAEVLQFLRDQALAAFRHELGLYEQRWLDEAALRAWWPNASDNRSPLGQFSPSWAIFSPSQHLAEGEP